MRAELRLRPHRTIAGEQAIEIWYGNALIGAVYGAEGPGIRLISLFAVASTDTKLDRDLQPTTETAVMLDLDKRAGED